MKFGAEDELDTLWPGELTAEVRIMDIIYFTQIIVGRKGTMCEHVI